MTETDSRLTDDQLRRLTSQIGTWRRDLLTLDRRQKLVYFKHSRTASLEVASPSPTALFTSVTRGPVRLVADDDPGAPRSAATLSIADKTEAELAAACRRLDLLAQRVYADRGFWTLYLGLGMLRWIDPADGKRAEAPVVLCPVSLRRDGKHASYTVQRTEDDLVLNPALRLHLEKSFGIQLSALDPDAMSIEHVLDEVGRSVAVLDGWGLEPRSVMTTFSFHKEAIYRDLEDHESTVLAHPIVQLIALGADAPTSSSLGFEPPGLKTPLDESHPPEDLLSILDADSSQRACIIAARDGKSFVMDGPPGTGKSQTIANIIAELIASNRTVLFVSEKAAALDVVRDRLASRGLGDFTLELHSHAATRKEVVKQLDEALVQRVTARGGFTAGDKQVLARARGDLTLFAQAMNERRDAMDRSLFEVLGRLLLNDRHRHAPLEDLQTWSQLSASDLDRLLTVADSFSRAWRPALEAEDFTWRDLAPGPRSSAQVELIKTATNEASLAASRLAERSATVDEDFGWSWPLTEAHAQRRLQLLRALEGRPPVPAAWLTQETPEALRSRVSELESAARAHAAAVVSLETIVGPGRGEEVDPDACRHLTELESLDGVPWSPTLVTRTSELDRALATLRATPLMLAAIIEDARLVGAMLGVDTTSINVTRSVELGHLGALAATSSRPERGWLNPSVQAALDESLRVLTSVVELVNERRSAVEEVFTPAALDADLPGLDLRFREVHTGLRAWGSQARADRKVLKGITVSRRADKAVRARLGEAVAWQKAERALSTAERQHADRLGSYYERTTTDFGRVAEAVHTAKRAVELAGNDLNGGPMAEQLSRDGNTDPRLTLVADRLLARAAEWTTLANETLGTQSTAELTSAPLEVAAQRSADGADKLDGVARSVRHVATIAGRDLTLGEASDAREHAVALSRALVTIFDDFDADRSRLGPLYAGLPTDWGALRDAAHWLEALLRLTSGNVSSRTAARMENPVVLSSELATRVDEWSTSKSKWVSFFLPSRQTELEQDLDAQLEEAAELLSDMHSSAVTDINEWDAFVHNDMTLRSSGLGSTVDHVVGRRVPATDVAPAFEWAMLQAWAEAVIGSDTRLSPHRGTDREALVEKFRLLDRAQIEQSHIAVAAACSARRPNSVAGTSAQLIRREAQKKTRHLPIRELLSRTGEVVQELKPCFMMSPLSVSQFLPADVTFDAVIFDEASQVLPSDAVNCIYRGGQLIVAGDEKQLPPTSFFTQAVSEEDVDEELDLFESVLKSCKSSMPSLPLAWHYRSQHEALIAYSNHRFYSPDNQPLQTFPGATFEAPDLGVESYVVNGVYRKGTTRDNPIEAEAVVDRVLFHRAHHPELSVGVVTFSSAQEEAIASAVEARSLSEPVLAGLLDEHDRLSGFFIKNLENVQGDERDIIIFSVGYGPDETGAFSMNFGPINRDGGWRRLNVAITRARRRVEVVSSFRASDMRETSSQGLRALRGYLDFAARGPQSLGIDPSVAEAAADEGADVLDDVFHVVSAWGFDVDREVGSADFRVGLAVRHPDRPGEFVLGIESDGPAYSSAATARDRDRLRANVLESLGWRLHRVWTVSWFRDRDGEIARLRAALDGALEGQIVVMPTPAFASTDLDIEEVDLDAHPDWATEYVPCTDQPLWNPYPLSSVEARSALHDYLGKVLAQEAPIHRDLLYRRIRDAFGVGRVGSQIKRNIDFVAERVQVDGSRAEVDDSGFFRVGADPVVRVPITEDDVRTVGQTPPEELDLAVLLTLKDAVTAETNGLVQAVRHLFGWRRAGTDIQRAVVASLERLERTGDVELGPRGAYRLRRS